MNQRLKKFVFNHVVLTEGLDADKFQQIFSQLPEGAKIKLWGNEYNRHASFFIVEHPSFDEVLECQEIPEGKLEFSKKILRSDLLDGGYKYVFNFNHQNRTILTQQFPHDEKISEHCTNWVEICTPGQYYLEGSCQEDVKLVPYTASSMQSIQDIIDKDAFIQATKDEMDKGIKNLWNIIEDRGLGSNESYYFDAKNYIMNQTHFTGKRKGISSSEAMNYPAGMIYYSNLNEPNKFPETVRLNAANELINLGLIEIKTLDELKEIYPDSDELKEIYPDKSCDHEWKLYEGIMCKYNYCTKCDLKKELK